MHPELLNRVPDESPLSAGIGDFGRCWILFDCNDPEMTHRAVANRKTAIERIVFAQGGDPGPANFVATTPEGSLAIVPALSQLGSLWCHEYEPGAGEELIVPRGAAFAIEAEAGALALRGVIVARYLEETPGQYRT